VWEPTDFLYAGSRKMPVGWSGLSRTHPPIQRDVQVRCEPGKAFELRSSAVPCWGRHAVCAMAMPHALHTPRRVCRHHRNRERRSCALRRGDWMTGPCGVTLSLGHGRGPHSLEEVASSSAPPVPLCLIPSTIVPRICNRKK
jgi:hypothetical protein